MAPKLMTTLRYGLDNLTILVIYNYNKSNSVRHHEKMLPFLSENKIED